jgi:hypothetical protein
MRTRKRRAREMRCSFDGMFSESAASRLRGMEVRVADEQRL